MEEELYTAELAVLELTAGATVAALSRLRENPALVWEFCHLLVVEEDAPRYMGELLEALLQLLASVEAQVAEEE